MAKEVKVVKRNVLEAIVTLMETMVGDTEIQVGDVIVTSKDITDYATLTIQQIDDKNEKARERAAKKKAESDELCEVIYDLLTEEFQTRDQVTRALDRDEVSTAMVGARLTKLVKAGRVVKDTIKVDGRTLQGYALAGMGVALDPEEDEE